MSTVWRKKAYAMFGFKPGAYSFALGKVELFEDLFDMAVRATAAGDAELLDRIFEYALWADRQNADNLRSAADIKFFMPVYRDDVLLREAASRLPTAVSAEKQALLDECAELAKRLADRRG